MSNIIRDIGELISQIRPNKKNPGDRNTVDRDFNSLNKRIYLTVHSLRLTYATNCFLTLDALQLAFRYKPALATYIR